MMDVASDGVSPGEDPSLDERRIADAIERLEALAHGFDPIVRDEIRAAFCEEFALLGSASQSAAQALHAVRRTASVRLALWAIGVAAACAVMPAIIAWKVIPSPRAIAQLRHERASLAASLARLEHAGAKIDLRRCGARRQLCVRVERGGPAYGPHADYLLVKGG
ncbi:MAG: hypothetical protein ACREU3_10925 [Steroidobacteraceae bacterium]